MPCLTPAPPCNLPLPPTPPHPPVFPPVLPLVPLPAAIKFMTYEQLSRKISHHLIDQGGDGQLTPLLLGARIIRHELPPAPCANIFSRRRCHCRCRRLLAAAGAGIIGMSATYPMDMVRGRITIQEAGNQQYRGLLHATGCIIRCGRAAGRVPAAREAAVQDAGM